MQLFNGLNMGIIKFYGLNFDNTPETGNGKPEVVDYSEKLNTINQKIDELKKEGTNIENDANAKKELNNILTDSFNTGFVESLNEYQKAMLKNSIENVLEAHKNEENFQSEYKGLIDLAKALGVNLEGGTETSEQPTEPKIELSGTLDGIKDPEAGKEGEKKLYSQLTRVAPQEGQNIPDDKNFYKTANDVKTQLEDVKGLLKNEKLNGNESLKGLEDNLVAIQTVIDNTTPDNVRILQKFISDNLDGEDKNAFDGKSKKGENFDGKFGLGTLAGLNKILEKTGKYIDSFKAQPSEGAEDEPFKNVKVKESIVLLEGDTLISAADLLESLPNGTTAEFKDNAGIDKAKTDAQEVTVVVKSGDKTKEITIIATVDTTNNKIDLRIKEAGNPTTPTATETTPTSVTTETSTTPTGPLEITINGKSEEHLVVTSNVAKKINTPLYYVNTGNEAASEQNNKVDKNGDREYLMQVNDETYKVKLDQNGNLKPLAINYESGAKLLLKNNPSCIAYLQNKIVNLPGSPQIAWNSKMEDYVIRSYGRGLTIEPMTLDGKRVSENLGQCLAFENLTNFLRGNGNIHNLEFKNDNPDLKLESDGLYVRIKKGANLSNGEKSGKWFNINLSEFGLNKDSDALKKFIGYNNHEDWDDDWDKLKDNKGYVKVQL